MRVIPALLVLGALVPVFGAGGAEAALFHDETPSVEAKPLSSIVKTIEDHGYRQIVEIEYDGGAWTVKAHQPDGKKVVIFVDPVSGDITREAPPGYFPF